MGKEVKDRIEKKKEDQTLQGKNDECRECCSREREKHEIKAFFGGLEMWNEPDHDK